MARVRVYGTEKVIRNMETVMSNVREGSARHISQTIARAENSAKTNRPWTDRTGDARRSITGSTAQHQDMVQAALAIGVFYGKYLELSNAGRFAIVWDTMMSHRQQFINDIERSFRL